MTGGKILAIALNDLRSDSRGKEVAPTMVLFALALVFLFSFALPPGSGRVPAPAPRAGAVTAREITAVFAWISILFASVLGFGRNASIEQEDSRIEGLLLAPVDPAALFIGKALGNFVFLCLIEMVLFPVLTLLVDLPPGLLFPEIALVALTANVGLTALGTLFGAASQYSRSRSLILPLITFPVILPVLLGASRLTAALLQTGGFASERRWFVLLIVYDLIFATIGAVTYEFVVQE